MLLFKNRNFKLLWIGHFISNSGDAIYMIALPWLLLDLTGSASLASLIIICAYLPAVFFGLFAGVIIDRYNRKWIMIFSDIARFLLVSIIPFAIIFNFISPFLIGSITFLIAFFSVFFYPARDSLIPEIISSEELPSANSAITISGQLSHFLGPLFASLGISLFGLVHLFTIDALTFFISLLVISLLSVKFKQKNNKILSSHWMGILEGLKYINRNKGLKKLLLLTFINNIFIMGPAFIGLPVFVREILNSDFTIYAQMESAMALGMIIGSFIFWKINKIINLIYILLIGIIIDGVSYSFLFFSNNSYSAIIILFMHGIGIPLITISRTTIVHAIVPDEYRGRIFSMIYMAVMGTTVFSIFLTGLALEKIGPDILFLIIGICAASTVFIFRYHFIKEMLFIK